MSSSHLKTSNNPTRQQASISSPLYQVNFSGRSKHVAKEYYMDVINILAPLNIFAGGLTIATQFIIPCSEPNLGSLLALASELFLASLAGLVIVFLLLYGFWDTDIIQDGPKPARCCGREWGRHSLVVAQIVIVGFMMIAAFFVLGVAIIVVGNHWARGFGMGLVLFIFMGAIAVGVVIGRNKYVRVPGSLSGPLDPVAIHDVERDLTMVQGTALAWFFLVELVIMVVLLGLGIWQAIDPPKRTCDTSSVSLQWPTSTIAFSEVNPQTKPLVTFTDFDTMLSITLTDIDLITRADSLSTISSTIVITTTKTETPFLEPISTKITSTVFDHPPGSVPSPSSSTLSSSESTPCSHCTPVQNPPPTFITSTFTSLVPCTTRTLAEKEARKS